MPESLPQQKTIPDNWLNEFSPEEKELIKKLKEQGGEDPETSKQVDAWLENAIGKRLKLTRDDIKFTLKRAIMFFLAGRRDEALEDVDGAEYFAAQLRDIKLHAEANKLMEIIK